MYSNLIFSCEEKLKGIDIVPGESYGSRSRCFDSNFPRPLCLETECNAKKNAVIVHINGSAVECSFDGQQIDIFSNNQGESIHFECPRKALICPE